MTARLGWAAFGLGAAVIGWVAAGYARSHALAFTVTMLIALGYALGALELHRFQQATAALARALAALPQLLPRLADWLDTQVPVPLRHTVRLRIEGERVGLPGPVMAPYLVGLLVLLGMLGTFLGLVVTLDGAVLALQSTTDLATIRAALTAPVKGLGLAFGTSVAGVAGSAMLGLMSALSRRDRLQVAQALDQRAATTLRPFSQAHQRELTLQALQQQAQALPALVHQLQAAMAQMSGQQQDMLSQIAGQQQHILSQIAGQQQDTMAQLAQQHDTLGQGLLAGQAQFHRQTATVVARLAESVDQSLRDGLAEGARTAARTLQPVAEATMAAITLNTTQLHAQVGDTVARQLEGVSARLHGTVDTLAQAWNGALASQAERFTDQATSLQRQMVQAHAALQADLAGRDQQRQDALSDTLAGLAATLQQAWQQAGAEHLAQQVQVLRTLQATAQDIHTRAEVQSQATVAEVTRLMQAAAEAPRAAAQVMGQLREQLALSLAQDNAALAERQQLLQTLATLLAAIAQSAHRQRDAVDTLVASAEGLLGRTGQQAGAQLDAGADRLDQAAAQLTGSAVEVASLGEAFGTAVEQFTASAGSLTAGLQRIEGALARSTARSDEQLAYYVAQAREIIDLSLLSQQQIAEGLRARPRQPAALADEAA